MKALVFGASGLVGGAAMRAFAARGHLVTGTCLRRAKAGLVPVDFAVPGAAAALVRALAPDAVVLAAAQPHVDRCEDEPDRAWRLNAEAPAEVARAAREVGAFVAFVSTDYVFDGTGPVREDAPLRPLNAYGRAKAGAELALQVLAGPTSAILRTTGVYGYEQGGMNFVLQLAARLPAGERMKVVSDQVGSPTSARSLAEALCFVCETRSAGVFHAAGMQAMRRSDLARLACELFGWDPSLVDPVTTAALGQRARRPLDNPLVNERLQALMGRGLEGPADGLAAMRREMEHDRGD